MFIKKSLNKYFVLLIIAWAFVLLPVDSLYATHSKILTIVPSYDQEASIWCGPATAQMIMEGYPSGGCYHLQEDIWDEILNNKVDTLWDTDPVGIEKAMEQLCPPTYGWVVSSKNTAGEMMYAIARNMNLYDYPVALVLKTDDHSSISPTHREHWVAVVGIVTDLDPVANTSAVLEAVIIHDPAHLDMGFPIVERYCNSGQWGLLFSAVSKVGSSYDGKYVAVMEPPKVKGTLSIAKEVLKGLVIKPELALENAHRWLERSEHLYQIESFNRFREAKPLTPMLVNKEYGGYYLIPYALEGERSMTVASVLVNAYEGNVKEVGVFKPVEYLSEERAVEIALNFLKRKEVERIRTELVTKIEGRSFHLYSPCWKITLDDKVVYVNQKGEVLSRYVPSIKYNPNLRRIPTTERLIIPLRDKKK